MIITFFKAKAQYTCGFEDQNAVYTELAKKWTRRESNPYHKTLYSAPALDFKISCCIIMLHHPTKDSLRSNH